MYAIVRSGGKQLRVEPGQIVNLERIQAETGSAIELNEVLMVAGEGAPRVGQPLVQGTKVRATVLAQGKARKVFVFHYKPKKNIRKRSGHRQPFTKVRIEAIELPEGG